MIINLRKGAQSRMSRRKTAEVRIIPPSEWAKLDVATPMFQDATYRGGPHQTSVKQNGDTESIENTVTDRHPVLNATKYLYVRKEGRCLSPGREMS